MSKTKNEPQPPEPAFQGFGGSLNEPPAQSPDHPAPQPAPAPEPKHEPLPDDLHRLTRHELDELAEKRGVDISSASNKDDVISLLEKDERKRKRSGKHED